MTRKQTNKIANTLAILSLIITTSLLIIGIYLFALDANPPIEFTNLPFPVDISEYRSGERITITTEYCRYTNVSYIMRLDFVDGLRFSTPEQQRAGASMGCSKVDVSIIEVPKNLPSGTYYLKGKNEYPVNFIANRIVEWTSEPFEVKP
jgi:hypothetical protein